MAWDDILQNEEFQAQTLEVKRDVAQNYFKTKIATSDYLSQPKEVQADVYNNFLKTIEPPPPGIPSSFLTGAQAAAAETAAIPERVETWLGEHAAALTIPEYKGVIEPTPYTQIPSVAEAYVGPAPEKKEAARKVHPIAYGLGTLAEQIPEMMLFGKLTRLIPEIGLPAEIEKGAEAVADLDKTGAAVKGLGLFKRLGQAAHVKYGVPAGLIPELAHQIPTFAAYEALKHGAPLSGAQMGAIFPITQIPAGKAARVLAGALSQGVPAALEGGSKEDIAFNTALGGFFNLLSGPLQKSFIEEATAKPDVPIQEMEIAKHAEFKKALALSASPLEGQKALPPAPEQKAISEAPLAPKALPSGGMLFGEGWRTVRPDELPIELTDVAGLPKEVAEKMVREQVVPSPDIQSRMKAIEDASLTHEEKRFQYEELFKPTMERVGFVERMKPTGKEAAALEKAAKKFTTDTGLEPQLPTKKELSKIPKKPVTPPVEIKPEPSKEVVRPEAPPVSEAKVAPKIMTKPSVPDTEISLTDFVRKYGGLSTEKEVLKGEIRDRLTIKEGFNLVNNKTGRTLDDMTEASIAGGFLPEGATIRDFLEAIDKDVTAKKAKTQTGRAWSVFKQEFEVPERALPATPKDQEMFAGVSKIPTAGLKTEKAQAEKLLEGFESIKPEPDKQAGLFEGKKETTPVVEGNIKSQSRIYWMDKVVPELRDYFAAYNDMGKDRLEKNRVKPEGLTATDWLIEVAGQQPVWEKGKKKGLTGIQMLNQKGLWPDAEGKGEALRKTMVASIKAIKSSPSYSTNWLRAVEKGDKDIFGEAKATPELPEAPKIIEKDTQTKEMFGGKPTEAPQKAKEPWEMTAREFGDTFGKSDSWIDKYAEGTLTESQYEEANRLIKKPAKEVLTDMDAIFAAGMKNVPSADLHRGLIRNALSEGKPIPAEVLKDYPELQKQAEVKTKEPKWKSIELSGADMEEARNKAMDRLRETDEYKEYAEKVNVQGFSVSARDVGRGTAPLEVQSLFDKYIGEEALKIREEIDTLDGKKVFESIKPEPEKQAGLFEGKPETKTAEAPKTEVSKEVGKITKMSPDTFLAEADKVMEAKYPGWGKQELDRKSIDFYKDKIQKGEKVEPLFIDEAGLAEGRHRAQAYKELGYKEIPVTRYSKGEEPVFARGKATPTAIQGALPIESIRTHVADITSKWKGDTKINTVQSIDELPWNLKNYIWKKKNPQDVMALFDPNTRGIHIIADNVTSLADVEKAIVHETTHLGLRDMLGDKIKPILMRAFNVYRDKADKIATAEGWDLSTAEGRHKTGEEILAYLPETEKNMPILKQLYQVIRRWLADKGFKIKFSDEELKGIVAESRKAVREGKISQKMGEGEPVFKRKEGEEVPESVIGGFIRNLNLTGEGTVVGGIKKALAPGSLSKEHLAAANVLRPVLGESHRFAEQASTKLESFGRMFDKMGVANKKIPLEQNIGIKTMDAISKARIEDIRAGKFPESISEQIHPYLKARQQLFDNMIMKVQTLGTGALQTIREKYYQGMWKKESIKAFNQSLNEAFDQGILGRASEMGQWTSKQKAWIKGRTEELLKAGKGIEGDQGISYLSKATLEGKKSFLKEKSFEDIMSAIEVGLKPVSNNPIVLDQLKLAEMQRYVDGHKIMDNLVKEGMGQYVGVFDKAPDARFKIDDPLGTVWGPPETLLKEYVDKSIYEGLLSSAKDLGVDHQRMFKAGRGKLGYAEKGTGKIVTQFGTETNVLAHEIGHQIDNKYNLWDKIVGGAQGFGKRGEVTKTATTQMRGKIQGELRALADLTFEGQTPSSYYKSKVRQKPEKMAHMLEAYIHAPEKFQKVAPETFKAFDSFIKNTPETSKLSGVKPGISLSELETKAPVGGFPVVGNYYFDKPTKEILDNYLSQSLYNSPFLGKGFKSWMTVANDLNASQLGGAFHAGFTYSETIMSSMSNVIKDSYKLAKGDISLADMGKTLADVPYSISGGTTRLGSKVLNAWLDTENTASEHIRNIAKAWELAGGRTRLESGLRNDRINEFVQQWYGGEKVKAALKSPLAFNELLAQPIMKWLVPRQKLGVFGELADRIIRDNPGKSLESLQPQFSEALNRVDARLGQVGYERLFMNKAAKNALQAGIRAPGWTGGTITEVGGSIKDAVKFLKEWQSTGRMPKDIPDRVAYTLALLTTTAVVNGALTYAFTGEEPEGMDYWAFRTGGKDVKGRPERFLWPTYAKDIFSYMENPTKTLGAKTHPIISVLNDILIRNKDYYGVEIRHPGDNPIKQASDLAAFGIKQFVPFWMRGEAKIAEAGGGLLKTLQEHPGKMLAPVFGIMPASREYTNTAAEKMVDEFYQRKGLPTRTPAQKEKMDLKRSLMNDVAKGRRDTLAQAVRSGKITSSEALQINREGRLPSLVRSLKHLTVDEAVEVWSVANEVEKKQLRQIMLSKIMNSRVITSAAKREYMKKLRSMGPPQLRPKEITASLQPEVLRPNLESFWSGQ